jgi:hypothetical protein
LSPFSGHNTYLGTTTIGPSALLALFGTISGSVAKAGFFRHGCGQQRLQRWFSPAITSAPDKSFDELQKSYSEDERLRVPARVFNAPEVI